jgi:hypothetical protein
VGEGEEMEVDPLNRNSEYKTAVLKATVLFHQRKNVELRKNYSLNNNNN